jgi:hypothetical protein
MDVILLLRAYASGLCSPSHCLEVGICLTIYYDTQNYSFISCLHGCDTSFLVVKKEHKLRVVVNRVGGNKFRIVKTA